MADNTADPAFDADALGALFNKAKAQGGEFTFAFGLASKPEECALIAHMRKPGKALKQEIKGLPGKIGKTCFGTFTVAEAEVRFLPEAPAKGMIKALKKRFRDAGMAKFKPVLVGPDGLEVDEDSLPDEDGADEDEAEDMVAAGTDGAAAEDEAAQEAAATALADLKRRLAALVPRVQAMPAEMAEKLRQACLIANQQIGSADAEAAGRTMDQIEAVLNRTPPAAAQAAAAPPAAPPPAAASPQARLQDALGKLVPRIRGLPEGEARNQLGTQAREVMALIQGGSVDAAMAALRAMSQGLLTAEAGGDASGAAKVDAMAIWRDAKEAADAGISALQNAIRGYDDPDLQRIAEFGLSGLTDGVQTALMTALFNYQQTSGAERAKAGEQVAAKAAEARKVLEADPLVALCEENPFGVTVDIRGKLGSALAELEQLGRAA